MKHLFTLSFLLVCIVSAAQTKEELIYPVVPIADECHFLFNDTTSVRTISKQDFLELKQLWTTNDTCVGMVDDTLRIKYFGISFRSLSSKGNSVFYVDDGKLNSEYQSAMVYSRKNLAAYTRVDIAEMQYEKNGAMYQIAPVTFYIDSIIRAQEDSCWYLFPIAASSFDSQIAYQNTLSNDRLSTLIKDSMGVNTCLNQCEWPDASVQVEIVISKSNQEITYGSNLPQFERYYLHPDSTNHRALDAIALLQDGDMVIFYQTLYQKNSTFYKTRSYYFYIESEFPCAKTKRIDTMTNSSMTQLVQYLRSIDTYEKICFENAKGKSVPFVVLYSNTTGMTIYKPQYKGYLDQATWVGIKALKKGDKLIVKNVPAIDTSALQALPTPFVIIVP